MRYWQVAAGDGNRDYSEVFLRFGLMLIGPGGPGSYFENRETYSDETILAKSDITAVRSFAEEVREDDVVVLKRLSGRLWEVLALGLVKGDYSHSPVFDDVEGWDLQHCRRVEWIKPGGKRLITGLTRGTFKRVRKESTIRKLDKLLNSGAEMTPSPVPEAPKKLDDEELIEILIHSGLRAKDAEDFTQTINRIRRLVRWYDRYGADIREHETTTFLIIPLLLALGWPEQRLKIEWNNIDIAFFEKPYSKENKDTNECITILESKSYPDALTGAEEQAHTYAARHSKCSRLIVSDGCRYKLWIRKRKDWKYSAYLNILKPRPVHPYEEDVGGAPDVFLSLMARQ